MKKIVWITASNFLDHSFIISEISKSFDIDWIVEMRKEYTYFDEEDIKEKIKKTSIIFFPRYMSMRYRSFKAFLFYLKMLYFIKKKNPDIIYVDLLGLPYFWILAKILLPTSKLVYSAHDVEEHSGRKNRGLIQYYQSFIFNNIKNFHLLSNTQYQIFIKRYPYKNTFIAPLYISNFGKVDIKPFEDKISFLFFGFIRENKGLNYLIEAGNLLSKTYPDKFKIRIAGRCNNWDYYKEMIQNNDVFELDIRPIPNEEISQLFLSSHYLLLPYIDVTQSGPLLISFDYNVPVIASDLDGFREYITDGANSFLFESENVNSLKRVMENAILNHNKEYSIIKSNLKEYVNENISVESIASRYVDFFNKL